MEVSRLVVQLIVGGVLLVFFYLLVSPIFLTGEKYDVIDDPPECSSAFLMQYGTGVGFVSTQDNGNDTFTPNFNTSAVCKYPLAFLERRRPYLPYVREIVVIAFERKWFGDCTVLTEEGEMWDSKDERACLVLSSKGRINATLRKRPVDDETRVVFAERVL